MGRLLRIARKTPESPPGEAAFPFCVPAIRTLPTLDMTASVTLFVGENGSGKSTLLEGIACAAELPSLGRSDLDVDDTLAAQRALASALRLSWAYRSREGFFLRSEDFFGHLRSRARNDARCLREKLELDGIMTEISTDGPAGMHPDEQGAARFISDYDSRSHGESFIDLFNRRLYPNGLYLLDEPESPLSPKRQLTLLELIIKAARRGAQFVIATHSPILLACPGACIYSFDALPIRRVAYADLEHVAVMRDFMNDPERFLRQLGT